MLGVTDQDCLSYLSAIVGKHLPGRHEQKTHGHPGAREVPQGVSVVVPRSRPPGAENVRVSRETLPGSLPLEELLRGMGVSSIEDVQDLFAAGEDVDVEVTLFTSTYKGVTANAKLTLRVGQLWSHLGVAERSFDLEKGAIHNISLEITEQQKGVASALYDNEIAWGRSHGYKQIQLFADVTIGRYAWARKGFDYANPQDARDATQFFPVWAQARGIAEPPGGWPVFKHAKDVADYDIPGVRVPKGAIRNDDVKDEAMHVGKAYMLDRNDDGHGSWHGVLSL